MNYEEHEKKKAREREYYKHNKEKFLQKNRKRREKKRDWFQKRRQQLSCSNCGDSRWYVLDFHHKNPDEKTFNLSVATNLGYSEKKLEEEISKCDVLCANCHRELHYFESIKKDLENK